MIVCLCTSRMVCCRKVNCHLTFKSNRTRTHAHKSRTHRHRHSDKNACLKRPRRVNTTMRCLCVRAPCVHVCNNQSIALLMYTCVQKLIVSENRGHVSIGARAHASYARCRVAMSGWTHMPHALDAILFGCLVPIPRSRRVGCLAIKDL